MASQDKLEAGIDWLEMQISGLRFEEICEKLLFLDSKKFVYQKAKLPRRPQYEYCLTYENIKIFENGLDCYLLMSGQGCTYFYDHVLKNQDKTWNDWFSEMKDLLEIHLKAGSRIDLKIDDLNDAPYFTPAQLLKYCQAKRYRYGRSTEYLPYGDERGGQTLYLGKPRSDRYIRIYDKLLEQIKAKNLAPDVDIRSWIRLEIQFRREIAEEIMKMLMNDDRALIDIIKGYLKDKLHFYTDDTLETEPQRWLKFLGKSEIVHLTFPKKITPIEKKVSWIKEKGPLPIFKAMRFLRENDVAVSENIFELTDEAKYPPELALQMINYVNLMNRPDLVPEIISETRKQKDLPRVTSATREASNTQPL